MNAEVYLRFSAQRALLTHVTPSLRAVSVEADARGHQARVLFIFDGEPSPEERESAFCAEIEIRSDYAEDWSVETEMIACRAPGTMQHWRWLVYHRCEDD